MTMYQHIYESGFVIGRWDPTDSEPDWVDGVVEGAVISKKMGDPLGAADWEKTFKDAAEAIKNKVTAKKTPAEDRLAGYAQKREDRIRRAQIKRNTRMPAHLAHTSLLPETTKGKAALGVGAALVASQLAPQGLKDRVSAPYRKSRDTRHYRPASPYYDDDADLGKAAGPIERTVTRIKERKEGKIERKAARETAGMERKAGRIEARTKASGRLSEAVSRSLGIEPAVKKPPASETIYREVERYHKLLPKSKAGKVGLAAAVPATILATRNNFSNDRKVRVKKEVDVDWGPDPEPKAKWHKKVTEFANKPGVKGPATSAGRALVRNPQITVPLIGGIGSGAVGAIKTRKAYKARKAEHAAELAAKTLANKRLAAAALVGAPLTAIALRKPVEKADVDIDKGAKEILWALRRGGQARRYNAANPMAPRAETKSWLGVRRHNKQLHPDDPRMRYGQKYTPKAAAPPAPAAPPPPPPKPGFWDKVNEASAGAGQAMRNISEGVTGMQNAFGGVAGRAARPAARPGALTTNQKLALGGAAAGGLYLGNKMRQPRPASYQAM